MIEARYRCDIGRIKNVFVFYAIATDINVLSVRYFVYIRIRIIHQAIDQVQIRYI